MIGNEHADALVGQVLDYSLNIGDGEGVDAGKRLVQQDESRIRRQGAGDFHPAPFAAREAQPQAVAYMADVQLPQQLIQTRACGAASSSPGRVSRMAMILSATDSRRNTEGSWGR